MQSQTSGGEGMEKAKSAAREVTSAAAEAATKRAQGFFDTNKAATVSGLGAVAHALRSAASDMEGGGLSGAARRAADVVEQATHALEQRDLDQLLAEAQNYARRQPAVFLGGAFAAGFALARLLKASTERAGGGTGFRGGFEPRYGEGQRYYGGARGYGREQSFGGEQGYPGGGQGYGESDDAFRRTP